MNCCHKVENVAAEHARLVIGVAWTAVEWLLHTALTRELCKVKFTKAALLLCLVIFVVRLAEYVAAWRAPLCMSIAALVA